jgi:hypothetical protein
MTNDRHIGSARDTPHFWGSTQTFYVVFVPARQKCGVSQRGGKEYKNLAL